MNSGHGTSQSKAVDLDWSEHERRQYERYAVSSYLRVVDADSGIVLGDVVDISLGGFKLIGAERETSGRRMKLRLEYGLENGRQAGLAFEATCVWHGADDATGSNAAGFAFRELSRAASDEIARLITELSA